VLLSAAEEHWVDQAFHAATSSYQAIDKVGNKFKHHIAPKFGPGMGLEGRGYPRRVLWWRVPTWGGVVGVGRGCGHRVQHHDAGVPLNVCGKVPAFCCFVDG
jgi:hypothetical protein